MKVYIVTSGEYSDYGIDAVFTDKKQAELYCAVRKECHIETYIADQEHLEGEIYYGIKAKLYTDTELQCAVIYSDKPITVSVIVGYGFTEYIIPVNKSYENQYGAMKKYARDYIAKYKAEKEGL